MSSIFLSSPALNDPMIRMVARHGGGCGLTPTVRLDETLQKCDWKNLDIGQFALASLTAPLGLPRCPEGYLVWRFLAARRGAGMLPFREVTYPGSLLVIPTGQRVAASPLAPPPNHARARPALA